MRGLMFNTCEFERLTVEELEKCREFLEEQISSSMDVDNYSQWVAHVEVKAEVKRIIAEKLEKQQRKDVKILKRGIINELLRRFKK